MFKVANLFSMFNELRAELASLPPPEELPETLTQIQSNRTGKSRKPILRFKLLFVPQGLKSLMGRPPTIEEIADACDESKDTIYRELRLSKKVEVKGEKKTFASVAIGLDVVSSSRVGLNKAVKTTEWKDQVQEDGLKRHKGLHSQR